MGRRSQYQAAGTPPLLLAPAALALLFLIIPLIATLLQVDFVNLFKLLSTKPAQDALWLSLATCVTSTALCFVLGVPLALSLARAQDSWFPRLVRTLSTLPMVLPPVVAGLALLITWGRRGLLGKQLSVLGIEIGFTSIAVVLAQTFVAMPFLVTSLEGALRTRGFDDEEMARILGASRTKTLFTITLPLSSPAIMSSTALAFSRALGEFGATISFAGSLQGVTRTLPLEIYLQTENDIDLALALSLVLVATAFVLVGLSSSLNSWWHQKLISGNEPSQASSTDLLDVDELSPDFFPPDTPGVGVHVKAKIPVRHIDVDIEFKPGSCTALMGPNGAGKSTILSLIAGSLIAPDCTVTWSRDEPPRIALLAQNPTLFPHMSVLNNVVYGLRCQGVNRKDAKEAALGELRALGMVALADRRPNQLSGGQAQRVAIARAMVVKPEIALLDEPTASLDIEIAKNLRKLLKRRLGGVTMILVTHDLAEAAAFNAQIVQLHRGKLANRK
ncbi:MAG: molybdate ABC transporter permease subunit [Chloroflexi bacterium]|nr:MAG: molybdate ABC transporter permease subunit [Chloroflexota bacterium]